MAKTSMNGSCLVVLGARDWAHARHLSAHCEVVAKFGDHSHETHAHGKVVFVSKHGEHGARLAVALPSHLDLAAHIGKPARIHESGHPGESLEVTTIASAEMHGAPDDLHLLAKALNEHLHESNGADHPRSHRSSPKGHDHAAAKRGVVGARNGRWRSCATTTQGG